MIQIKEYTGHIRNWRTLLPVLGIDPTCSREEREREIILKGYQKWGDDLGARLHGMFAIILYDDAEDRTVCIRDPFGTRTLYYYIAGDGSFLAGHSIRKIMEMPGFRKEVNHDALELYLTFSYPAGEETFFKGLKKLMPGRVLVWKNGEMQIKRFWQPKYEPDYTKTEQDFADMINGCAKELFAECIEEGEEPESFLSGGVDSAYIAAMSKVKAVNSIGYTDKRFDESYLAEEIAQILGKKFNRCVIEPEQYFAEVPYVMYNMEQPLADASAIVFSIGCKATAEHAKLVYSGEASDEFFCGYHIFHNAQKYADNLEERYIGNTNIMKEDEKKRILKNYTGNILPIDISKPLFSETKGMHPLTKMQNVDVQIYFDGDIQLNVDKMSEAAGLEIRMPLLDTRMFGIAASIPPEMKLTDEQTKVVFRKAAEAVLPEEIAQRKKLGFIVPIRIWLADERYNSDVREKFTGKSAEQFFNTDEIMKIYNDYVGGEDLLWRKIWVIYTFLVWYEEYFVKR